MWIAIAVRCSGWIGHFRDEEINNFQLFEYLLFVFNSSKIQFLSSLFCWSKSKSVNENKTNFCSANFSFSWCVEGESKNIHSKYQNTHLILMKWPNIWINNRDKPSVNDQLFIEKHKKASLLICSPHIWQVRNRPQSCFMNVDFSV